MSKFHDKTPEDRPNQSRKISFTPLKATPLKQVSLIVLIPNLLTLISLCAGFGAIRFALSGQWGLAVGSIFLAALFDGLDGRVARLIGGSSRFGAELDSLSDFVSFGVAPGLVVYVHSLHLLGRWGWFAALFFTICNALRLARFNTISIKSDSAESVVPVWVNKFFLGVPVPIGAAFVLLPLLVELELDLSTPLPVVFYLITLVVSGILLISKIPTYSFKSIQLDAQWVIPLFLAIGLLVTALFNYPWLVLIGLTGAYLCSIPMSIIAYKRLSKKHA